MTAPTKPVLRFRQITYAQHQGWACVLCGASLWTAEGGVSLGHASIGDGPRAYTIEVYACPRCASATETTTEGS
ncbi:hypothetical protein [Streptomyces mexicanus]|uniref:hypothetical protein n=1 Tax=Streptomyces mexicanus TaxID=178566 RepID=UPI003661CB10